MEVRRGKDADMDRSVPLVLDPTRDLGVMGKVSGGQTRANQEGVEAVLLGLRCLGGNRGCCLWLPLLLSPSVIGGSDGVAREDHLQVRRQHRLPVSDPSSSSRDESRSGQEVSLPALTKIKSWLSLFNNLKEQRICRQGSKFFNPFLIEKFTEMS